MGLSGKKSLAAVQGFGRPVARKGAQYESNLLSGSSLKSFTPDTAVMNLDLRNRQDENVKRGIV